MQSSSRMTALGTFVLVTVALGAFGSTGWFAALFIGLVMGVLLGAIIYWLVEMGTMAIDGSDWAPAMPTALPDSAPLADVLGDPELSVVMTDDIGPAGDAQLITSREGMAEGRNIYDRAVVEPEMQAQPDNLRAIKGVGVKIEEALNEAGVTRFDQIAAWNDEKIDELAGQIGRGAARIRGDDWVGQAEKLAQDTKGNA
jgi:predicted flap endonuclease-1-like 5' DNA nuclease